MHVIRRSWPIRDKIRATNTMNGLCIIVAARRQAVTSAQPTAHPTHSPTLQKKEACTCPDPAPIQHHTETSHYRITPLLLLIDAPNAKSCGDSRRACSSVS
jgi:hypothetical protein